MVKRKDIYVCPNCGYKVKEPEKTWQLIAPIPDSRGRITITVMGSFKCPQCGSKWRGVVSKVRAGAEGVEVEGVKGKKALPAHKKIKEERKGAVFEIDIGELEE